MKRAPLSQRGDDFYATPGVAVRALVACQELPHWIWEPACGDGAIVSELRDAGHGVVATDLVDRGCPESRHGWDFLMEQSLPAHVEAIVTNPPFKNAEEFVRHALRLCPKVIMLLRLAFMESDRRTDILDRAGLCRVLVFRKRLPMMRRAGWEVRKANSGMAFAWFVWERDYDKPATIERISWEPFS